MSTAPKISPSTSPTLAPDRPCRGSEGPPVQTALLEATGRKVCAPDLHRYVLADHRSGPQKRVPLLLLKTTD